MKEQITFFFETLAERHWIENDLSDMLWAMIQTNAEFRKILFSLFTTKHKILFTPQNFINSCREFFAGEAGRPDLKIDFTEENAIILEVKIFDNNYHLEYNKLRYHPGIAKGITEIALLTTTEVNEPGTENWIKIRWEELAELCKGSEDPLVAGFSKFIMGICKMKKIEIVKDFQIRNLLFLNRMIERALMEIAAKTNLKIWRNTKSFTEAGSGFVFEAILNENIKIFPWLGINYNDSENPFGLMLWLNADQQPHCGIARWLMKGSVKERLFPENDYFVNIKNNEVVVMPQNWENNFTKLASKEEQIQCIRTFTEYFLEQLINNYSYSQN